MPVVTSPDNIPAPTGSEVVAAQAIQDLASATQAVITRIKSDLVALSNTLTTAREDVAYGIRDRPALRADMAITGGGAQIGTGSWQRLGLARVRHSNGFPTRTNDTNITIPRTGIWHFEGRVRFGIPGGGVETQGVRRAIIRANSNGSNTGGSALTPELVEVPLSRAVQPGGTTINVSFDWPLVTGNTVEMFAQHNQGDVLQVLGVDDASGTFLAASWIAPIPA